MESQKAIQWFIPTMVLMQNIEILTKKVPNRVLGFSRELETIEDDPTHGTIF